MPTEPSTTLPLSVEDLDLVVTTLEDQGHVALPQLRWLLLGPYATAKLFPPYFCLAPTREQVEELLFVLEQGGQRALANRIQALAGRTRDHLERQLDHLETLPRDAWRHPAQILRRPWELEDLLNLCRQRMDSAGPDRRLLLESIADKLEKAQRIEARAAERRHLRTLSGRERREQRRHG